MKWAVGQQRWVQVHFIIVISLKVKSAVGHLLYSCWSANGQLLISCWSADDQLLVSCWSAVHQLMDISWSADGQLLISWWSADGHLLVSWWSAEGQLMVSWWSPDGQLKVSWWSADGQRKVSWWSYLSVTRASPPSHDVPRRGRTCPRGQSARQTCPRNRSYNLQTWEVSYKNQECQMCANRAYVKYTNIRVDWFMPFLSKST